MTEPTAGQHTEVGPILLYDGVCNFCNGTVRFILRHDRSGTMRFAPLQGPTAQAILKNHAAARNVDSLILVSAANTAEESVVMRSTAVIEIARYLGGVWRIAAIAKLIPRSIRDVVYAGFARVRYKVFGRLDACPVPSAKDRARFLP